MGTGNELVQLEQALRSDIPLARHMQVRVVAADADRVVLGAPLDPNANDKGTAFGGSLYSVAVLAGWALLSREMRARGRECQVVIQQSSVDYLQPVNADFEAEARAPEAEIIERCVRTLMRYGRARVEVQVTVEALSVEVMHMRGRYVIAGT